jgi:TonB family protein
VDRSIKNITLNFSCPIDWDSLEPLDGAKYCNHCHKKVYDFSNANRDEFLKILAQNGGNLCGKYHQSQMAKVPASVSTWKKWISAAVLLVGANILNNRAEAQSSQHPIVNSKPSAKEPEAYVGGIGEEFETMPEFPGGLDGFTSFVSKNIHYSKKMGSGRVFVSFVINKAGNLNDFKIERSVNPIIDKEAIRVLKLSPKWKPATQKGKPVTLRYIVPLNFKG